MYTRTHREIYTYVIYAHLVLLGLLGVQLVDVLLGRLAQRLAVGAQRGLALS